MAYRPLYSGDLAALNVAAADQERNAIAARSGNQAFLQGLARVALERRGQDVDSSKAAADRENRLAIAQLLDATTRYSTDSNASTSRQRNANDLLSSIQRNEQELARLMVERDKVAAARSGQASQERMGAADRESRMALAQLADATARYSTDSNAALGRQRNANDLLASIQRNEQALAQLMVERDRIAALERQGIATNQLEKDKIAALIKQAELNRDAQVKIAKLQFSPDNLKVDPRVQNEILGQNAEIDDFNSRAASFADVLNSRTKSGTLGFGGVTPEDTFKTLSPEEAMLVQVTEDPVIKTRKFVARQRARLAMPSLTRSGSQASATNTPSQTNSSSAKVREFDWRALVPQAAAQAPSQSSPENYLSALASIAGSRNNQRAAGVNQPADPPQVMDPATMAYVGGEYDPATTLYRQPAPTYQSQIQDLLNALDSVKRSSKTNQTVIPAQPRPAWAIADEGQPVRQSWVSDIIARMTGN